MTACIVLTALGACVLIWYIREKLRAYSVKALLLKAAVSTLFVAVGFCGWYTATRLRGMAAPMGALTVLGLVLGLQGDVWLDLKYVFPEKNAPFTYAGFAAFGVGHVLFLTGLLTQFYLPGNLWRLLVPFVLGGLLSLANLALERPMKLHYGRMKPVCLVYGFLLFSTVLTAGSLALLHGWQEQTLNLFFLGAILFALSDLVLSGTYFGKGRERPRDLIANYVLYYGGQFLIAFSLLFLS